MAYAAARMAESTLLGLQGEPNITECAFVQTEVRYMYMSARGGKRCSCSCPVLQLRTTGACTAVSGLDRFGRVLKLNSVDHACQLL